MKPLRKTLNLPFTNLLRHCGHQSHYVLNIVLPNICSEITSCQVRTLSLGYAIILHINKARQMVCISKLPNHWDWTSKMPDYWLRWQENLSHWLKSPEFFPHTERKNNINFYFCIIFILTLHHLMHVFLKIIQFLRQLLWKTSSRNHDHNIYHYYAFFQYLLVQQWQQRTR